MSTVHPTSKTCTECGQHKPLSEYYTSERGLYGRRSKCKRCISDQRNAYGKQKRRENPELFRQRNAADYQRHREKRDAAAREYSKAHPWYDRYKYRRLRAERLGASVIDLTAEQWTECLTYFGVRCAYCHEPLTQDAQDHIVPLSRGGNHTLENVAPVCRSCNASKHNHSLTEWLLKGRP